LDPNAGQAPRSCFNTRHVRQGADGQVWLCKHGLGTNFIQKFRQFCFGSTDFEEGHPTFAGMACQITTSTVGLTGCVDLCIGSSRLANHDPILLGILPDLSQVGTLEGQIVIQNWDSCKDLGLRLVILLSGHSGPQAPKERT